MSATPVQDPEKTGGLVGFDLPQSSASGIMTPHGGQRLAARARERIRNFLHPDGRRIHVASSPDEANALRRQLQQRCKDDEFDVYISGTPEHLEALRHAQSHHEERREKLRTTHKDIYEQFFHVHTELDQLAYELDRVTTHGVSLEAHFSKFGYNAHIKSYDDEDSPSQHSGATTPRKSSMTESGSNVVPLKLFTVPTIRQYFHKGVLWRSSGAEEVQSFELFADLLYVGILAAQGDFAAERPTGLTLLQFVITFTLSFKIWSDFGTLMAWFGGESDDVFQRVSVMFLLSCLFGYTTNITTAFDENGTYPTMIGFYVAARLFMASYLFLTVFLVKTIRGVLVWTIFCNLIAVALWIASIHVEWPNQLALIFVALAVDIMAPSSFLIILLIEDRFGAEKTKWLTKWFEFLPAANIEHKSEEVSPWTRYGLLETNSMTRRTNAFVSLVFGYTVVAILYQSTVNGIDAFFGKGILGLIQAFCFNWLYFDADGANLHMHAIRRHKISSFAWIMAHLPFIMAFILAGGALSRLVLATDNIPGSEEDWMAIMEHLGGTYQAKSEHEVSAGIRWFYCGGLAVALFFMSVISYTHVHKEVHGQRMRKEYRLLIRNAVAVIILCLPLAEDRLNSIDLVGTVTALIVFALATELWFGASCNEALFSKKPCTYTGECGKKQLAALIRNEDVDTTLASSNAKRYAGCTMGV